VGGREREGGRESEREMEREIGRARERRDTARIEKRKRVDIPMTRRKF